MFWESKAKHGNKHDKVIVRVRCQSGCWCWCKPARVTATSTRISTASGAVVNIFLIIHVQANIDRRKSLFRYQYSLWQSMYPLTGITELARPTKIYHFIKQSVWQWVISLTKPNRMKNNKNRKAMVKCE